MACHCCQVVGDGVTELLHQRHVDPEHVEGEVVAQALELAPDVARGQCARRVAVEHGGGDEPSIEHGGEIERRQPELLDIVLFGREDDVRPTVADTVEEATLLSILPEPLAPPSKVTTSSLTVGLAFSHALIIGSRGASTQITIGCAEAAVRGAALLTPIPATKLMETATPLANTLANL